MHVQIWSDMLKSRLQKGSDSRPNGKISWSFWCDKVQPAIRKATGQRIFGIGQPMAWNRTDLCKSFYTFMDAYNVKLVDDDGKLFGRRSEGERRI